MRKKISFGSQERVILKLKHFGCLPGIIKLMKSEKKTLIYGINR